MCGIFGVWERDGASIDVLAVERAVNSMRHRGPDDEGYVLIDTRTARAVPCRGSETAPGLDLPHLRDLAGEHFDLALGHRRLAILDTSSAGHQPMTRDSSWIVHSGEIFNYEELRRPLSDDGHRFVTGTDTEVILATRRASRPRSEADFDGMWAYAIFDLDARTLVCSRDPYGIKPFHFRVEGSRFVFSSEIRGIAGYSGKPLAADTESLSDYLAWGISDHTERTFFEGVGVLPAGHRLTIERDGMHTEAETRAGTRADGGPPKDVPPSSATSLREALRDSVQRRLRSDVPVGTLLSGGVDSSSVTCFAREVLGPRAELQTFTATFDDAGLDERPYAEAVAGRAKAENHFVRPDGTDLLEVLPTLLDRQEGPVISSSVYAQWKVMELVSAGNVTVLLDGQGGDELFSGYPQAAEMYLRRLLRSGRVRPLLAEASAYETPDRSGLIPGLAAAAFSRSPARLRKPPLWMAPDAINASDSWRYPRNASLEQVMHTDLRYRLPSLLRFSERNSMAFGLEVRMPFLENHVERIATHLGDQDRIHRGVGKAVLRDAMRGSVPDDVLDRRTKNGFLTPERHWMLGPALERIREIVLDGPLNGSPLVRSSAITDTFDSARRDQFKGRPNDIWRWLNASIWLDQIAR